MDKALKWMLAWGQAWLQTKTYSVSFGSAFASHLKFPASAIGNDCHTPNIDSTAESDW